MTHRVGRHFASHLDAAQQRWVLLNSDVRALVKRVT